MSELQIATGQAFSPYFQRGKRVVAEISLPRRVVESVFRSTPEDMVRCHNAFMTGRRIGGDLNDNVMLSNGLTALFIALGQVHQSLQCSIILFNFSEMSNNC